MRIRFSVLLVCAAMTIAAGMGCSTCGPRGCHDGPGLGHGGGLLSHGGGHGGGHGHGKYNLPPAERLMHPGPGVTGPGPGVLPPVPMDYGMGGGYGMGGVQLAAHHGGEYCADGYGYGGGHPGLIATGGFVQVEFAQPTGMQIRWDASGMGMFDSDPRVVPAKQSFGQGGIYRLKLTNIVGREGVELYPTLEVGPVTPRTEAFLAHSAVPVQFTEEDFDQVLSGNFVTKVIYLPNPEFQELALAGVETLVSTRLDPGVDPIVEADRRGSIIAIVRVGNKDLALSGAEAGGAGIMHGGVPGHALGAPVSPVGPVVGYNLPQYGMPITGTPIGLPGPPHIPLGVPAGLQKHVMRNHTHMRIPDPVERIRIDVKQSPGMSYPQPVNRVHIHERADYGAPAFHPPHNQIHINDDCVE